MRDVGRLQHLEPKFKVAAAESAPCHRASCSKAEPQLQLFRPARLRDEPPLQVVCDRISKLHHEHRAPLVCVLQMFVPSHCPFEPPLRPLPIMPAESSSESTPSSDELVDFFSRISLKELSIFESA